MSNSITAFFKGRIGVAESVSMLSKEGFEIRHETFAHEAQPAESDSSEQTEA